MMISLVEPIAFRYDGQRPNNEDFIWPELGKATQQSTLFIVCDGMGGWDKGEVASKLVAETIATYVARHPVGRMDEAYLKEAINVAHQQLVAYITSNQLVNRMGTTMALLHLHEAGVTVATVGDSRVYHIRDGQVRFQTTDHRQVLEMVRDGIITEEQAKTHPWRNRLSRSIAVQSPGADGLPPRPPDRADVTQLTDLQRGDYFFLCTDGVLEQITTDLLTAYLATDQTNADKLAAIVARCEGQTKDNYAGYLIQLANVVAPTPIQERSDHQGRTDEPGFWARLLNTLPALFMLNNGFPQLSTPPNQLT